ncbi:MAG: TROVE domain-containing protein [Prevotella sp.]|nr:TROVE domain-containing protein [Prevotella sp.]
MSYNEKLRCDNLTTNHEGAVAWRMTPEWELYTTVVTTMGTEDKFYEGGEERAMRIAYLVRQVDPVFVAQLAIYARERMHLRSVPLLLLVELSLQHKGDSLVSRAVSRTIQRADEMAELLMCHQWRTHGKHLDKVGHQLLKGLAGAFNHFDEYQLAKYDRRKDKVVTMRDALLLAHPKPKDEAQAELFRKVLKGTLETPCTWETRLSAVGKRQFTSKEEKKAAKREVWSELIAGNRLGYMAALRNLRNLLDVKLDDESMGKVCRFLSDETAVKRSKQLPFRFLSAYLELTESRNNATEAIENALARVRMEKEKAEAMLDEMRGGVFFVSKRKVNRYLPVGRSLFDVAVIRGKLDYPPKRKKHHRLKVLGKRKYVHPNQKCLAMRQRQEDHLSHLQHQEEKLQRKLEKRMEKMEVRSLRMVLQALEQAVRHSADNIPGFTPDTRVLLASDTSGSMFSTVSRNSKVMNYHVGLLLSMLMKHRCRQAVTGMFGDIWKEFDTPSNDILRNTMAMMEREGEVGYSTNGYMVIEWLIREKRVMDKVMLFTDCQLWNSAYRSCDRHLAESWGRYKELAPDAKLYLFDLAGYGQSPVSMVRDDVFCIAGWSDKVFDILTALENGSNAIDEIRRIVV